MKVVSMLEFMVLTRNYRLATANRISCEYHKLNDRFKFYDY